MEDKVIFREDSIATERQDAPRGLSGLLIVWGIAKDEDSAGYILLGVVVFCVLVAVVFFVKSGSSGSSFGNYNAMRAEHPELFQNEPTPAF